MSRFKNNCEQKLFIDDSTTIFNEIISQLPIEHQQLAIANVDEHYKKWKKVYTLQSAKLRKGKINIKEEYKALKNSVQFSEIDPDGFITMGTIEECVESLLKLKFKEKAAKCHIRQIQYQAGEVAKNLRNLTLKSGERFAKVVKEKIGYSDKYAYFLINLFEACIKFSNLRYTTYSTNKLKNNLAALILQMEQDLQWWSLPRNVPAPNMDSE